MWSRSRERRKGMEGKEEKVIESKNQCETYLKSIELFRQTDADKMSVSKDQAMDLAKILDDYRNLLNMMLDSASIYI